MILLNKETGEKICILQKPSSGSEICLPNNSKETLQSRQERSHQLAEKYNDLPTFSESE